jgi:hypothetical protein
MKQLTIYCSSDEESRVITALDHAGVEGFFRVGDAAGNKFLDPGQVPRAATFEAIMIVVPAAPEEKVRVVTGELGEYTRACEIEPCLRMVVSAVEEVY